ncbi:DUF4194 domain-containing protein [Geomonas sp. Red32]|uniref:DUF4194 domain-containing protein n=1 Tax=Geomonas sp. Red32 TaxID=2912856 RepID=UPI00202CC749|nr:DUF4194 domain-containing protein [Geomonas sp. Red32]MCM0080181.1 DUF4194 domain-containing protein [Geomonas sp. Red32]
MLNELKRLLDAEADLQAADMRQTASVLLERQFLYADQSRDKKHYHRVIGHIPYFTNLFDALNRRLVYDQDYGLVGILPQDGARVVQLAQEESLLLLCLRLLYEEGVEKFEARQGSVFTETEALLNRYQTLVRRERPGLVRLREILRTFCRFGIIEVEDEQDRVISLQIRPAVRLVTTEGYIGQLESMISGGEAEADGEESEETGESADEEA